MTRKLFSLTLSAFALLLLMGAGVEQSSAALVSKSNGTAAEAGGPAGGRGTRSGSGSGGAGARGGGGKCPDSG